eukprot:m.113781 g.113781  ORF g.113781 m.113781 type:complete len:132 (-) comp17099_c0_seq1:244-639(-)
MSWQAYIDTSLLGAGTVSKAAIHGKDGNVWATSAGFNITPQEAATVVGGFTDQGTFYSNGVVVGGKKYKFLRTIDTEDAVTSVLGKEGDFSICVEMCGSCIIVGISETPTQPSSMVATVGKLGDYLRQSGY